MAKLPYMQFYPADYLRDTRCLSLPARGVWMDVLCALWNAPKRGQKTLSLEGWAGEIGQPKSEVSMWLLDLELNGIGKFIHEVDGKLTIISRRMVRDERNRKAAAKRKQDQRDRSESRLSHMACPPDVTGIYQNQSQNQSQNQKSESESEEEKSKKKKKEKKILPASSSTRGTAKSSGVWDAYSLAYRMRYGVDPVRDKQTNISLCQLVEKLGAEEAPLVAKFYLSHNHPWYVSKRHPPNLLVQDATGLRTQWATGVKATTGESRNLETQDNMTSQYQRVLTKLEGV